ncbi:MAG: translocation/assembly module TamB domain-containing protein, partial [Planctomycetota bacterium]
MNEPARRPQPSLRALRKPARRLGTRARAVGCLGFVALLLGATFFFRAPIVATVAEQVLPGILSRATGQLVRLRSTTLTRERRSDGSDAGWTLRLNQLSASDGGSELEPWLTIERGEVRFPSLWSLRDPVRAITAIDLDLVRVRKQLESPATDASASSDWLPAIVLPQRLPTLPFPIRVANLDFTIGPLGGRGGTIELASAGWTVRVSDLTGVPQIESAQLTARVTENGVRDIVLRAGTKAADEVFLTGELVVEPEVGWVGRFGPFEIALPTRAGDPAPLRASALPLADVRQWLSRWTSLAVPALPPGTLDLDLRVAPSGISGKVEIGLTAGEVRAQVDVNSRAARIRALATQLALGDLLGPHLVAGVELDLATNLTVDATLPLTSEGIEPLTIEATAQAADGLLIVQGQPFPVHRCLIRTEWHPAARAAATSRGAAPLWASAELYLAEGSFTAEGSGTPTSFEASVHMEGLDVGALIGTVIEDVVQVRAPCSGDFTLTGPLASPTVRGSLTSRSGHVTWLGQSHAYQALGADAYWQGSTLEIANVRARVMDETMDCEGELRVRAGQLEHLTTRLVASDGKIELRLVERSLEAARLRAQVTTFDPGRITPLFLSPVYEISSAVDGWVDLSWDSAAWRVETDLVAPRATFRAPGFTAPVLEPHPPGADGTSGGTTAADSVEHPTASGSAPFSLEQLVLRGSYGSSTGLHVDEASARATSLPMEVRAKVSPAGGRARVTADFVSGNGSLEVTGVVDPDELDLTVELTAIDVAPILGILLPEVRLTSQLTGTVNVTGSPRSPHWVAQVRSPTGNLEVLGQESRYDDFVLAATYDEQGLHLDDARVVMFAGTLAARGRLALLSDQTWGVLIDYRDLDIGVLRGMAPILRGLAGEVSGHMRLTGPSPPKVTLAGAIRRGEVAFEGWERLRSVEGRFTFANRRLEFFEVEGKSGDGALSGVGTLEFAPEGQELAHYSANVVLDRVLLGRSADAFVRVTGKAALTGTPEARWLRGDLEVVRGLYYRNYYPRLATGTSLPFELFAIEDGFAADLQLDLDLQFNGGFRIENNRVAVTPRGNVRLLGTGRVPYLVGQVLATEGQLTLPHLVVEIGYAELNFPIDDPFRPTLSLQGEGTTRDHEIQLTVTGPFDNPEVRFRSTPELPDEEVLALVATGRFPEELSAEGAEQVAAIELARVYAPEVVEWIFGRSTEGNLLDAVDVGINSARNTNQQDRITVRVRLNEHVAL